MIWAIGGSGLRTTLTLSDHFAHVLNHFLAFEILGVTVPTGLLLFVALVSFFVWLLFQTKTGGGHRGGGGAQSSFRRGFRLEIKSL